VTEKFLSKQLLKAAEDLVFDPAWETLLNLPAELPVKDPLAAFTETAKGAMALVGAVRVSAPPGQTKRKRSFPEPEGTKDLRKERRRLRICFRTDGKGKVESAYGGWKGPSLRTKRKPGRPGSMSSAKALPPTGAPSQKG
jgi:hypothetical protein